MAYISFVQFGMWIILILIFTIITLKCVRVCCPRCISLEDQGNLEEEVISMEVFNGEELDEPVYENIAGQRVELVIR
tara:strand:+ start:459 stop:689 length:231 start_codon:yes stop_codon:yes gene_type:complete